MRKPFFFCVTICHWRTCAPIAKKCGVVFADNAEAAEQLAWEKHGSDIACDLWVEEVTEDGYDFTVYKSEIG